MSYENIEVPAGAEKITVNPDNSLNVPDTPIIAFIEGDGIGVDITPVMRKVIDVAVSKAYDDEKKIAWMEIYAGEKAVATYGGDNWMPAETLEAAREYVVAIKARLLHLSAVVFAHSMLPCARIWIFMSACVRFVIFRVCRVH